MVKTVTMRIQARIRPEADLVVAPCVSAIGFEAKEVFMCTSPFHVVSLHPLPLRFSALSGQPRSEPNACHAVRSRSEPMSTRAPCACHDGSSVSGMSSE